MQEIKVNEMKRESELWQVSNRMLGIDCFCEEEQGEALVFKFVGNSLESEATVTFLQTVRFSSHLFYFFFQRSHFQSLMGLQSTLPKNKMGLQSTRPKNKMGLTAKQD